MNDKKFISLLKQVDEPFLGWDFSFISSKGRFSSLSI